MVATGALPRQDAVKAVDLETIALLLGMMIVVASLRRSGFFAFATVWVMARAKHSGFDRQLLKAEASGVTIGFWDHFRVGAPLTLITLAIGVLWLSL